MHSPTERHVDALVWAQHTQPSIVEGICVERERACETSFEAPARRHATGESNAKADLSLQGTLALAKQKGRTETVLVGFARHSRPAQGDLTLCDGNLHRAFDNNDRHRQPMHGICSSCTRTGLTGNWSSSKPHGGEEDHRSTSDGTPLMYNHTTCGTALSSRINIMLWFHVDALNACYPSHAH